MSELDEEVQAQVHDAVAHSLIRFKEKFPELSGPEYNLLHGFIVSVHLTSANQACTFLMGNDGGVSAYDLKRAVIKVGEKVGITQN